MNKNLDKIIEVQHLINKNRDKVAEHLASLKIEVNLKEIENQALYLELEPFYRLPLFNPQGFYLSIYSILF